jgi:TP901 family phage tail tape measure protein
MATDLRDIFMVIRAKDQASRVIAGLSRSASTDFRRLQTAATLTAQKSAIDMQKVRQNYAEQILHQQRLLNTAMAQGNTQRVKFRQGTIRDLRVLQQEEVLGIRREQIMQRQIMLTARKHAEAKAAARDAKVEAARSAGQWIAVGAGMAIAGGAGVKALHSMAMGASEFQREATLTLTQVSEMGHSTQELLQISANVATKVGAPYEQMQTALYDIFSSTNVRVSESQGVLEKFAKAAVAGQVDVQHAGSATISIMNGYKKSASDLTKILDVQFAAVRLGRMTYDEFAAAIGKAIPSAVAANQSFETLAGSMAFLTRSGLTASQAAISFARLSDTFTRADVPGNLRKIGIEAYDAQGRMKPINVLLTEMAEKFKPLSATARAQLFAKIFGGQSTIQARRFFNLAINNAGELNKYINDVKDSSGEFGTAYNKMAETTAVKTELLKNNWKEFKRQIGEQATPALNRMLEVGLDVLGWLNRLSPGQKRVLASTIALTSVVVGLSGVLIALAGTVKLVAAGIGILRVSAMGATGALQGLGGASITARLGLLGIFATVTALLALKMNDELHKGAEAAEEFGRTTTIGGKGGQLFADRVSGLTGKTKELTTSIDASTFSVDKGSTARHKALGGIRLVTGAHKENTKALGENKEAVDKVTEAVKLSIPEFRGVETQVKKTAAEVNKQLEKEIRDYTNWSKNIQTLIKAGVDPKFIQMLSKRGPEYVAAYANGSKTQLSRGVRDWKMLHGAMSRASQIELGKNAPKGSAEFKRKHAVDVEAARRKHAEKMAAMRTATMRNMIRAGEDVSGFQKKVNNLKGKSVNVTAVARITLFQATKNALLALGIKGYGTKFLASGGPVRGPGGPREDRVPAWLSNGEYVVNAASTAKYRAVLDQINAQRFVNGGPVVKKYADGGLVADFGAKAALYASRIGGKLADRLASVVGTTLGKAVEKGMFGGLPGIKNFIRSTDRLPYVWAAAGPNGYDCSGLVSAVHGMVKGLRGAGHGLRLYTTGSIRAGIQGLKSGLGGVLQIGVTSGTGHMAGRYGGLGFEAESSRTGIKIGAAASRPESFARHYHLARGGYIDPRDAELMATLSKMRQVNIGGDAHKVRMNFGGQTYLFHQGGRIPENVVGIGSSGRRYSFQRGEEVVPQSSGGNKVVINNTFNNTANPQQVAQQLGWELSIRI